MIKVSGDFAAKLSHWAELLNSTDVLVSTMSRAQAEVSLTLIGEGFDSETDPYGEKWALKKVDDGRKVLHGETTRLRNGWHIEGSSDTGFEVAPSVDYAAYHQTGTSKMVPRKMVPDTARGLPKEWADEFRAVALAKLSKHFGPAADGGAPSHKPGTVSHGGGSGSSFLSKSPANDNNGRRQLRTLRRLRTR